MPSKNSEESTSKQAFDRRLDMVSDTRSPKVHFIITIRSLSHDFFLFSKISPYPNHFERQVGSESFIEHSIIPPTTWSNVPVHGGQMIPNQRNFSTATNFKRTDFIGQRTEIHETQKNPYHRALIYASIAACTLIIAAIVIPLAIFFGLPQTSASSSGS